LNFPSFKLPPLSLTTDLLEENLRARIGACIQEASAAQDMDDQSHDGQHPATAPLQSDSQIPSFPRIIHPRVDRSNPFRAWFTFNYRQNVDKAAIAPRNNAILQGQNRLWLCPNGTKHNTPQASSGDQIVSARPVPSIPRNQPASTSLAGPFWQRDNHEDHSRQGPTPPNEGGMTLPANKPTFPAGEANDQTVPPRQALPVQEYRPNTALNEQDMTLPATKPTIPGEANDQTVLPRQALPVQEDSPNTASLQHGFWQWDDGLYLQSPSPITIADETSRTRW
jgi:hypothetical protein